MADQQTCEVGSTLALLTAGPYNEVRCMIVDFENIQKFQCNSLHNLSQKKRERVRLSDDRRKLKAVVVYFNVVSVSQYFSELTENRLKIFGLQTKARTWDLPNTKWEF
jgi:hypothetical protein